MKIPFRVAIVALVVGLLVVTCGVLITFVLQRGQQSVEVLRRDYLEQVAETSVREVARLPQTAAHILRVERFRLERGQHATRDPIALASIFAGALQADPSIQWVSYGEAATGRFMGATRADGALVVLNVSDPRQNRGVPREMLASSRAPYTRTPPLTQAYDPRTRGWYQQAVARPGTIVWTPPYEFAEGETGITAAVTVLEPRGGAAAVRGVLTVDFTLGAVGQFLENVQLGRLGIVVLFTRDGERLAGPRGPGRDAAARAIEGWSQAGARASAASGTHHAEALVAYERWDVAARIFSPGPGLDWIVAVAVPNEAFMGPVHANRRLAIGIALCGLALAVLAGIVIATGIARSLGRATHALDDIARFELDTPQARPSVLREVSRLQDAVGRVTASLRSFSRYAPEEIVRDVVISGQEARLSGEKREVTILFSDLRGFTGFAERFRPEEVVAILNDHFDLVVGIIARRGGFVVDFLGDAVFAVFGALRPDPDHAEHAVACAIEMQRARTRRNAETRELGWPPLEMGVGLNTGPAVVGNMGSRRRIKYGVVGHVVNVAARIEAFTVGGQVLASDEVRVALRDRLVADGPLEAEGKGVGAAMELWDVRALGDDPELALPAPGHDLAILDPPLDAGLRLILGKQIDTRVHPARLHRLGPGGAELETGAPLQVFGPLQLALPAAAGGTGAPGRETVDGKVVALAGREGARTAMVRFTGLDWDARARIEALADRSARGGA